MCRRNGREKGEGKDRSCNPEKARQARIRSYEALGGWGWRRSMGNWEAGPTAIVYSPASQVTITDRLLHVERHWVPDTSPNLDWV